MSSVGLALCALVISHSGPVSGAAGAPVASIPVHKQQISAPRLPQGLLSLRYSPRANTTKLSARDAKLFEVSSLDRARFFEETDEEVYHENKKNPIHALGLALLPNLFYKPLAIGLAWKYCDKGEDKDYLAFFTAVPGSGFGSYYSEWHWAGAIATVGDAVGSSLMAYYFYEEHATRNDPGGSMTKFYAGLGVAAFFWAFDIVMGPVAALQFNSALRKRYLHEEKAPKKRTYVTPPKPDTGVADIGPRPQMRPPVVVGYAGRF
jgi:hypothetical protein